MMEVCDAVSVGQSRMPNNAYLGDAYLRSQHRISPPSYPYHQNGSLEHSAYLTSTLAFPTPTTTATTTVCTPTNLGTNLTSPRSFDYYPNLPNFNLTSVNSNSYPKTESDGIPHLAKLSPCDMVCSNRSLPHPPFGPNAEIQPCDRMDSKCHVISKPIDIPTMLTSPATAAGLVMHGLSQWDVNDPKLPKIRQFDTFTMWPQGHCRLAYRKSASDGARRHASGWAMRNTNNHNSQILKKSCLGVLLCSTKRCPLAMRPAICDKARRRQEGRPCCMPNCNGRIYIQPCRGHGGYPVTHFWREHGDTVYFQAKGTHDHVRPDLKPVRDTAGRRRRQMQLDKESSHLGNSPAPIRVHLGTPDQLEARHNLKTKRCKDMMKVNPYGQIKKRSHDSVRSSTEANLYNQPFQKSNELGSLESVDQMSAIMARNGRPDFVTTSKYQSYTGPNQLHPTMYHNSQINTSPPALQTFPTPGQAAHHTPMTAEPIFPSENSDLDIEHNPVLPKCSIYPSDMTTKGSLNLINHGTSITTPCSNLFGEQLTTKPPILVDPNIQNFGHDTYYSLGLTRPDHTSPATVPEQNYPIYPLTTRLEDHPDKQSPFNKSNQTSFYQSQLTQLTTSQPLISTGGTNSESTSGGLNASWSTPSPPTGGSSSLFGEIRTLQSGFDDTNSQNPPVLADTKDAGEIPRTMTNMYAWNDEDYAMQVRSEASMNLTNLQGYGLATPTHFQLGNPFVLGSDQNAMVPSLLMSSSTPVSYGRGPYPMPNSQVNRLAYSYSATGYVTPIPFYLSSSDSQSTRTDSSSETSHGSQRISDSIVPTRLS